MADVPNSSSVEKGATPIVCSLSRSEILTVITGEDGQEARWVITGEDVYSKTRHDENAVMAKLVVFTPEWVDGLKRQDVDDVLVVIIPIRLATTEAAARALAAKAIKVWNDAVENSKKDARNKAKLLTQKAKQVCLQCAALQGVFTQVDIFDEGSLATSPFRDQMISLGRALEELADVIEKAISDLLNGNPGVLREILSSAESDEVTYAIKVAIDAVGAGNNLGLSKRELEDLFHATFFPELFRGKYGVEHAARVYETIRQLRPKLRDISQLIRDHGSIHWMNAPIYRRKVDDPWQVERIPESHVLKVLLISLMAEYHERSAKGEGSRVILENMAERCTDRPNAVYSPFAHVTKGQPVYAKAWSALCNRFGVAPRKAIVLFSVAKTLDGKRTTGFKGSSAKYIGVDNRVGISLGDRDDLKHPPQIWLFWKMEEGKDGKEDVFKLLEVPDVSSPASITTASSENGEGRMALILMGWDINAAIFGRRCKVIGLLDNDSFGVSVKWIQKTVVTPFSEVIEQVEEYYASRSLTNGHS